MGVEYTLCRYRVDPSDRLVWVDDIWLAFARENGAVDLTEDKVCGRSLWDFVSDEVTREVYLDIHARVRLTGSSMVLPFRCDSPSVRRQMQLTITGEQSGHIMYDSLLLKAESRRWLGALESKRPRSDVILRMCSCCKRVLTEPMGWLDLEDAYVTLRIFEAPEAPQLQYTVCPECPEAVQVSPLTSPS